MLAETPAALHCSPESSNLGSESAGETPWHRKLPSESQRFCKVLKKMLQLPGGQCILDFQPASWMLTGLWLLLENAPDNTLCWVRTPDLMKCAWHTPSPVLRGSLWEPAHLLLLPASKPHWGATGNEPWLSFQKMQHSKHFQFLCGQPSPWTPSYLHSIEKLLCGQSMWNIKPLTHSEKRTTTKFRTGDLK